MFARLFSTSGLSLDRLRALVEVGAAGSIVRAADADPVRQSQYSRQIKELEDFFQIPLTERHGKGLRLTPHGKELARISRFFLMGLSNFQRGCLAEDQVFRIGASATFIDQILLPALVDPPLPQAAARYAFETTADDEIERRLHDLTLDFGVITAQSISRPLQTKDLGPWKLTLWVPRSLCKTERQALQAFQERRLQLALPAREWPRSEVRAVREIKPRLTCDNFLEARTALEHEGVAAFLPQFLPPAAKPARFFAVRLPATDSIVLHYSLAWNPRLLRLNPHAARRRDSLFASLKTRLQDQLQAPGRSEG